MFSVHSLTMSRYIEVLSAFISGRFPLSKVFDIGNGTVWPNMLTVAIMFAGKEENWL